MVPWGNGGKRREGGEFWCLGSGWGVPPVGRLVWRQRAISFCHTLIRVNTI